MQRWLKKHIPTPEKMRKMKGLKWLSKLLDNHPELWAFNRGAVARGVAAGLFVAFIPIPIQILLAPFAALIFRANLPITFVLTLISNPLTFIPFHYMIYKIGALILNDQSTGEPVYGKSYLTGLLVTITMIPLIGFFLVEIAWELSDWWRKR